MSRRWTAPLLAASGALLLGGLVLMATGYDPWSAYTALLEGAFGGRGGANLAASLNRAIPIIGMGLAAAIAFRAGLYNIGGEGQLVLGGITAASVAVYLPLPGPVVAMLALLAAAAVGGAYAWVAAVLDHRFGMPLLLGSLLLIYPARAIASYLVGHPLRDVASGLTQTERVAAAASLPRILDSRVSSGLLLVLAIGLGTAWILKRTRFGYRLRMTGLNRRFSRFGGVDVAGLGYRVMFWSGATAGLVGAIQVLAIHQRFIDGSLTGPLYAWIGIMVALLAGSRPLGVLLAGFLFAALQTGGLGMERATEVPRELSRVLQALVILLVAAAGGLGFAGAAAPSEESET